VDTILQSLGPDRVVLDLGCGGGSFQYASYKCKIIGIDVRLDAKTLFSDGSRVGFIGANSHALPLPARSIDFAVCNHSLEHVAELDGTLTELARVLKPDGLLWISVPNGFGLDDHLYRFLYAGGGHVNRFSYSSLKDAVEKKTGMTLLQSNRLTSSFIYCKRAPDSAWAYLPRRLKILQTLGLVGPFAAFQLNAISRLLDRVLHTHLSQYGWGFLFGRPDTKMNISLPSYFNVCVGCGCGNAAATLKPLAYRRWAMCFYRCPRCNDVNLLFDPPAGFD